MDPQDVEWMKVALRLASNAALQGEVPVGAVVVREGVVIGHGANARETRQDPVAHAEVVALQAAAHALGRWRLTDCTLYVTLEPCAMCAGALVNARIGRVVFGCVDPKAGAVVSVATLLSHPRLNHRPPFQHGVLEEDCARLLKGFFQARRAKKHSRNDGEMAELVEGA